jgi:citrate synthase
LLHRGYPIDQLAEQSSFMEVAYSAASRRPAKLEGADEFVYTITRHTMVHEQLATFYNGFRRDAHPMAIMCGVVGALSAFYHDSTDITDPQQRLIASHRLIAKMPTIAAMAHKYSVGQPFRYPQKSLATGNFRRRSAFAEPYEVNRLSRRRWTGFILHADHEQNASTSTVRLADCRAPTLRRIVPARLPWARPMGCQRGRLNMLREIGDVKHIREYIAAPRTRTTRSG